MRDTFEKDLLQFLPHRFDFCIEGHKSDTFDFYVPPPKSKDLLVFKAEDEFLLEKVNWEQMLMFKFFPTTHMTSNFISMMF